VAVIDPSLGMTLAPEPCRQPKWSIAEFRQTAKRRFGRRWIGCLVGGGLASGGLALFLAMFSLENATAGMGGMVGILSLQCGGVLFWQWHLARGLRCPECDGELLQLYRLVISSHRCYHCGSTVLGSDASG
jgi:hypothetical protein